MSSAVNAFLLLQRLASRCVDVIELLKAGDALALKNADLSGLAKIAYHEQQGDGRGLLQSMMLFSQYLKNNVCSELCGPNIDAFVAEVDSCTKSYYQLSASSCTLFASNHLQTLNPVYSVVASTA